MSQGEVLLLRSLFCSGNLGTEKINNGFFGT